MNMPANLVLDTQSDREVNIELSGRRLQAATLKEGEVQVRVNLGTLSAGKHLINLSARDVDLPLGLRIDRVFPSSIKVFLKPASQVLSLPKKEDRRIK